MRERDASPNERTGGRLLSQKATPIGVLNVNVGHVVALPFMSLDHANHFQEPLLCGADINVPILRDLLRILPREDARGPGDAAREFCTVCGHCGGEGYNPKR